MLGEKMCLEWGGTTRLRIVGGFFRLSQPGPRSAHLTSAPLQFGVGRSPYKKSQEKIFLCASTTKIFS